VNKAVDRVWKLSLVLWIAGAYQPNNFLSSEMIKEDEKKAALRLLFQLNERLIN
jgi:hypothetical protein